MEKTIIIGIDGMRCNSCKFAVEEISPVCRASSSSM